MIAGDGQPPEARLCPAAANDLLGNAGRTVTYASSPLVEANQVSHGLQPLLRSIDAGEVAALVIVGGDPAYTASADQEIARRIAAVPLAAYVGLYENETAHLCRWFVPEAHFLEAWSDARAFDGTASIAQPLMRPLAEGKTVAQVLAGLDGATSVTSRELVESYWKSAALSGSWERALVHGVVSGSADTATAAVVDWGRIARELASPSAPPAPLEVVFFADAKVHDGRFANSAWLQELGDPVTKLAWDNAALVSPSTATRAGVSSEDVVEIEVRGRTVRAPVLILPGMADDVVAIALGYGQAIADRVSSGAGANAYAIRDSRAPWFDDAALRKTGGSWPLALTQEHWSMEGRPIVLCQTLDDYRANPGFAAPHNAKRRSLYGIVPDARRQWGMTIDLNACTGCSACVIACMAENNIPVVGKGGVRLSREMQWIRIDRYLSSDVSQPAALVQPMLCQHCEKAPCEYVCPVNATVHSHDGLNEMVYNRCVGTRFCSNNCPYKVRRFNFFNYNSDKPEELSARSDEPGRHGPRARRDGEMLLLRAADSRDRDPCGSRAAADPRPRDPDGVPADVPDRGHRLRGHRRSDDARIGGTSQRAAVRRTRRAWHHSANSLPCPRHQSEPRDSPAMTAGAIDSVPAERVEPTGGEAVILSRSSDLQLTDQLLAPLWRPWPRYKYALMATGAGAFMLFAALTYTAITGIGLWGNNIPVAWAFAIINFVWWIGIGHAGTFISAILLLLEVSWRTSINRFAEGMTLFAIVQAGLFPIFHLGRPWFAYWLVPYPSEMGVWPNFKSSLPWDVVAVSTYLTVSFLFWYSGLLPDLAAARDRAPTLRRRRIYGVFALGWRGDSRHWRHYRLGYLVLGGLATPLVLSVHSIISLDFAITQLPGWHSTIFPPYFVAGAIYSGFAMVVTLMVPARAIFGLEEVVTKNHLDNIAKMLLVTGWIVTYAYIVEAFMAWYSGNRYEFYTALVDRPRATVRRRLLGSPLLQLRRGPGALESPCPNESRRALRDRGVRAGGHVGRALHAHHHVPSSRLPPVELARLHAELGRLDDPRRDVLVLPLPLPALPAIRPVHPDLGAQGDAPRTRAACRSARRPCVTDSSPSSRSPRASSERSFV